MYSLPPFANAENKALSKEVCPSYNADPVDGGSLVLSRRTRLFDIDSRGGE